MDDAYLKYIERRLNDWAEWFSGNHSYALGYPPNSMEYLLMTHGCRISTGFPKALPTNEEAEEIEDLIREMAENNYNMALALRCYYFTHGGLRTKAKRVNISHSLYKNYVDMGHQWLAGRLSAYTKKGTKMLGSVNTNML